MSFFLFLAEFEPENMDFGELLDTLLVHVVLGGFGPNQLEGRAMPTLYGDTLTVNGTTITDGSNSTAEIITPRGFNADNGRVYM
jgi:uncharacterized surface protein with fasciclin (FAS1) repeats